MPTNDKNTQQDNAVCLSFGKRYLVVGVLAYILSVLIALNTGGFVNITPRSFMIYSGAFVFVVGTAALSVCVIFRKSREVRSFILSILLLTIIFVSGFCRVYFINRSLLDKASLFGQNTEIVGIVKSEPVLSGTDKSYAVDIDVLQVTNGEEVTSLDSPHLILLNISSEISPPQYGDCISAKIRFTLTDGSIGSLRSKRILQSKSVFWGYTDKIEFTSPPQNSRNSIGPVERAGRKLRNAILNSTELISYGSDEKALLQGLLIGETSGFSTELYEDYTSSGFIHIASVSGMHTSYIFLALSVLLGSFRLRKRMVALISIPLLYIFCAIALFTPSVCRAVVMMIVLLSGLLLHRHSDSITSLAFAAAILITDNPYCLEAPGFLMSFCATLAILLYYRHIISRLQFCIYNPPAAARPVPKALSFISRYITSSVCLSLSGMVGLAYFTMHFFGRLQWGSIIGNLLMFPLTAVSFIGGYINCAIYYASENAASLVAYLFLNPVLWLMNKVTDFFATEIFDFNTRYLSAQYFPVYLILCIILFVWLQKDPRQESPNRRLRLHIE